MANGKWLVEEGNITHQFTDHESFNYAITYEIHGLTTQQIVQRARQLGKKERRRERSMRGTSD